MTNQLQKEVNNLIDNCLDVNGSWRDTFNELAILFTMGLDIEVEGTTIGDFITEEMEEKGYAVEGNALDGLVYQFLADFNYRIPADWFQVEYNLEMAKEVAFNNGADEDYVEEFLLEIA